MFRFGLVFHFTLSSLRRSLWRSGANVHQVCGCSDLVYLTTHSTHFIWHSARLRSISQSLLFLYVCLFCAVYCLLLLYFFQFFVCFVFSVSVICFFFLSFFLLYIPYLQGRKEMFYLTTHSTHFIYSYMASDIW